MHIKSLNINTYESIPVLNHSDVHLYQIKLMDYGYLIPYALQYLDGAEHARANRYHNTFDTNRFIICRILLKFILSFHSKLPIEAVIIHEGQNKKPFFKAYSDLHFNVSHSQNYALIGVSKHAIGVDVEMVNPFLDIEALAHTIFNGPTLKLIEQSATKHHTFFSLWTRKEAFVKALGHGIDDNFTEVPCSDGLHVHAPFTEGKHLVHLKGFELVENYLAAVAYTAQVPQEKNIFLMTCPHIKKHLTALKYG